MKTANETESDGARLKKRFAAHKSQTGMSKAEFARTFKIPGGASMISQHISGHRPISLEAAVAYMRGFNCNIFDISPSLAAQLPQENQQNQPLAPVQPAQAATNSTASIEELMNGLAAYLAQMDDIARRDASYALERLTTSPDQPERAAALFSAAFQPKKQATK